MFAEYRSSLQAPFCLPQRGRGTALGAVDEEIGVCTA